MSDDKSSRVSRKRALDPHCPRDVISPCRISIVQIRFTTSYSTEVQAVSARDQMAQTKTLSLSILSKATSSLGSWSLHAKPYKTSYLQVTHSGKKCPETQGIPAGKPATKFSFGTLTFPARRSFDGLAFSSVGKPSDLPGTAVGLAHRCFLSDGLSTLPDPKRLEGVEP